jgi:autotransporter-associated beta strand protein
LGTLTLGAANTYTGITYLNAGNLTLAHADALKTTSLTVNGGNLLFDSSVASKAFSIAGLNAPAFGNTRSIALQNTAADAIALTVTVGSGTTNNYGGTLSGSGTLVKEGAGILNLNGVNSHSATTLSNGTLTYLTTSAKSGITAVAAGTTLGLGFHATASSYFNDADVVNLFAGTLPGVTMNAASFVGLDTSAGATTFSGNITGSPTLGLVKLGGNTLSISGVNTYTGDTIIKANAIQAMSATALGSGNITFAGTAAQLTYSSGSNATDWGSRFKNSTTEIRLDLTGSLNVTLNGVIDSTNIAGLNKVGGAVLALYGENTYTGGTKIDVGTIAVNSNASLGNVAGNLTFTGNTTLRIDAASITSSRNYVLNPSRTGTIDTNGNALTNNGTISGSGSLAKIGTGTLTLSGANTYTGATLVSAGTLLINGSTASASAVTVNSGGTLGGNGSIGGAVTVKSGGTIAPGNSPGVLTVSSLTLESGSTTAFEINGITTAGTDYDRLVVNTGGGLTLNGAFAINFGNLSALSNTTNINLISFAGGHTGNFNTVSSTGFYSGSWTYGVGDVWTLSSGGQTLTFAEATGNLSVVPEPATWVLLGLGLTTLIVFRRRS